MVLFLGLHGVSREVLFILPCLHRPDSDMPHFYRRATNVTYELAALWSTRGHPMFASSVPFIFCRRVLLT